MLRTALRPKWLMLLVVAILVAIAFVQLGRWQLGRAHDKARAEAIAEAGAQPVVPLESLLTPHTDFPGEASGRQVTATGTYAEGQVLVPGRLLNGREGNWVVTPLITNAGTFPVVRGFTEATTAPAPPSGEITVTASLAPGESPAESAPADGQLGSVDLARLVNLWPTPFYNGFGFAQREDAGPTARPDAADASTAGLTRIPPPMPDTGLNWQNAGYAFQWWVFAAFAFFLWLRMVQADGRTRGAPHTGSDPPADEPGEPDEHATPTATDRLEHRI